MTYIEEATEIYLIEGRVAAIRFILHTGVSFKQATDFCESFVFND